LKKQYDDLLAKLHQTEFKASTYKRGLDVVEAQLVIYRKNKVLFSKEVAVLKSEVGCKTYEFNILKTEFEKITDNSKKGLGYHAVPPPYPLIYNAPTKLDLSYSGLEEFKQPEFEGYVVKVDKSVCEKSSKEIKKTPGAPIIEDWVLDDEEQDESKPKKKSVIPTVAKIKFVRPKQQEKPARKPVKYAEMYRSQSPRGNQRNWNNQKSQQIECNFVMIKKGCYVKPVWNNSKRVIHLYSTRITHPNPKRNMIPQAILMRSGRKTINVAKPKAVHNVVKASAYWVWKPKNKVIDHVSKYNNALITLKRFDYIDAQGRFKSVMAWVPIRRWFGGSFQTEEEICSN
ncbi:hypothetical protein Tco_1455454, partial [Tanacetum coccineum]